MASIVSYGVQGGVKYKDTRDLKDNEIVDKIRLKTSQRVTWSQLRNMAPVPKWNQPHPRELGFYLDIIHPTQISRLVWELDAEYTIFKGGQQDPNPTSRPAEISGKSSLIEQPTFFDYRRRPITTTAGEFIPGVMQSIPITEYTVEKNLSADPGWIQTHVGGINEDAVRIRGLTWAPKTLMLGAVSFGAFKTEERATYSEYSLTIMADPRTWTHEVWNVGTVELYERDVLINGKFRTVWSQRDITRGSPPARVEDPVPLDDKGRAIVDYLNSGTGEPMKTSRLRTLKFDTQNIVRFGGVLPLV